MTSWWKKQTPKQLHCFWCYFEQDEGNKHSVSCPLFPDGIVAEFGASVINEVHLASKNLYRR